MNSSQSDLLKNEKLKTRESFYNYNLKISGSNGLNKSSLLVAEGLNCANNGHLLIYIRACLIETASLGKRKMREVGFPLCLTQGK